MDTIDLKPRAIAVLCALRSGPKTSNQLGTAIGDGSDRAGRNATRVLLDVLSDREYGKEDGRGPMIVEHGGLWYLDHDGLGWLQGQGLDAVAEARAWNVQEGRVRS